MHSWLEEARTRILIADGAMGTELHRRGIPLGTNLERTNLTLPEIVAEIHRSYIRAGARLIETNTFGANPIRLGRAGLAEEMAAINRAGVKIAREAAGDKVVVAGAVGPLGRALAPVGTLSREEAEEAFRLQIAILVEEGVDLILLETFADIDELLLAARVALATGLPVIASLAFDEEGFTATGVAARTAAAALTGLPLLGIGANCGTGPEGMVRVAAELRLHLRPDQLLCLMPNAGLPRREEGRTVFPDRPAYFGEAARKLWELGANIIGGCCGSGPDHIMALARSLAGLSTRPRPVPVSGTPSALPSVLRVPSAFHTKLEREFVCTVELAPPKGPDPTPLVETARALKRAGADAVNVADGPMARVRMGSVALAHRLQEEAEIEVLLHLTCRDRNLIGLQAELLGAAALGIRNILALTGDPPRVGDHPEATPVFDVDATGLVRIMARMNEGFDLAGNPLGSATGFAIGVAANPTAADPEAELARLGAKFAAGADFCLTQPVFAPEVAEVFLKEAAARFGRPIILGLWPLGSLRQAEYLAHEVPGILVPPEVLSRLAASPPTRQAELGLEMAFETFLRLKPFCAGVCLMTGGKLAPALALLRKIKGVG
ncbi:MAG: bifunctional homocysteine S-methyltransferase/methylenetetrahydrofolate reductase [Firmicutes bacterium]|nr:bifunctional homocysteine S-methyltransferase/methylenetetrahydrofolate reductase [Bacillota bacterium]